MRLVPAPIDCRHTLVTLRRFGSCQDRTLYKQILLRMRMKKPRFS
jgi:hypothetical protein